MQKNHTLRKIGFAVAGIIGSGLLSATMVGFGSLLQVADELEVGDALASLGHPGPLRPPLAAPTDSLTLPPPLSQQHTAVAVPLVPPVHAGLPEEIREFHKIYQEGGQKQVMRFKVISWVRRRHQFDIENTERFLLENKHYLYPEGEVHIDDHHVRTLIFQYRKKVERDAVRHSLQKANPNPET